MRDLNCGKWKEKSVTNARLSVEEKAAWDVYFAEVTGWTFHPGYYRENATKPTLTECAHIADQMLDARRIRFSQVD